jgi:nucleoside-diphosphate-sugar epimerase
MNLTGYPVVLITGATGAVGPQVVRTLHNEGYRIRTLSLNGYAPGLLPDDVETRIGDITKAEDVRSALEGCNAVIHLAALLHIVNPPDSLRSKYEKVNVGGTQTVVQAAIEAGVKRLVYFSTINVYGPSFGRILTETTPPNPNIFYAETKLAAEKIVLESTASIGGPLGVVLRLGAVYGSRIKGNYSRLLESLVKERFVPVGSGANRRTLVYDKDVAQAAVLALRHPNAAGKVFNVTDGTFHTVSDIVATICMSLGRKPPRFALPVGPARLAAGIMEDGAKIIGLKSPISRATIDKYTEDIAVDGTRIQRELGFMPAYDLDQGWHEIVAEMRHFGDL